MAEKHDDEATQEFDGEDAEETLDLAPLTDEDLIILHNELVQDYYAAKDNEEFAADMTEEDRYEDLASRVAAIQFVESEMADRVAAVELESAVEESAEFASSFVEKMKAARKGKGKDSAADKAEDAKDAGADEEKEAELAAVVEPVAEVAPAVEEIAPAEEVVVETAAEVEPELVESEVVEDVVEVASSEELSASNTDDTTTATKEATVTAASTPLSPAGLPSDRPAEVEPKANVITASADIPGFAAGQELTGIEGIAKAFIAKRPRIGGTDPGNDGYRYLVATIQGEYPEDRHLHADDVAGNMAKIEAVTSPQAIVASGGFCAPLTPYYSLQTFGVTSEPVRDSLPNFKADRGGITFMPPPRLSDVVGSVRRTTAAQDAAGYTNQTPAGTTAPKPCLHVTCLPLQSVVVEAISRCLTFGNLGARTFPEQVEAWLKLSLVQFARYSEIEILDALSLSSTPINAAPVYGLTSSFLEQVSRALAAFKYRHRIEGLGTFRAIIPRWVKDEIRSDIAFQGPGDGLDRLSVSDAEIDNWFAVRGINPTWHLDNSTAGAGGVPFGAQNAGALLSWPTRVEWFLFPEGSFLYLDSGSIDLGLVRDSILNSQNDYQIFAERFQGVAFVGVESYRVVSHLCVNGASAGLVAPASCTGS